MATSLPRTIDYIEVPSREVSRSRAFFTALFGWRFTDYGPDYSAFEDGRIAGGFFTSEMVSHTERGGTLVVIYTETLEATKAEALRLGATLTKDIFSFPGGRRFQFTEPGGSEFSVWSDK
ncbi:MAG: VOC family protein [Opitutaceae bacterium]|nr:VOC family protein [Opitutaceae bacterium]